MHTTITIGQHRADMGECEFCYDHLTWHDSQLNLHAVSYLLIISNNEHLMTDRHFDWSFNADTSILQISGIVLFHCFFTSTGLSYCLSSALASDTSFAPPGLSARILAPVAHLRTNIMRSLFSEAMARHSLCSSAK